MENRPSVSAAVLLSVVGAWLAAYFLFTIVSSSALNNCAVQFQQYNWVELAFLQHSSAMLLGIMLRGKSILLPALNHKLVIFAASTCNAIGNLATNAAFTLVPSSVAHVVESCQPVVTFVLMLIMCSKGSLDVSSFLSVSIIVLGVCTFPVVSTSFNSLGLIAALISMMAFSVRNVLLNKLGDVWEGPLAKFFAVSIVSSFLLFPVFLLKVLLRKVCITQDIFSTGFLGFAETSFQLLYTIASFKVLEVLSPVSHAIVAISIRLVFYASSIEYSVWRFLTCFAVLFVGLYFYRWRKGTAIAIKFALFVSFTIGIFLTISFTPAYHLRSCDQELARNRISMAWVYDAPIPSSAVSNIQSLAKQKFNSPIYVYCGTTECVGAITKLELPNVNVKFAVISDIVKNTPLQQWLARHPLNKVLAGKTFEVHLQEVTILGILQKYGGFYANPMLTNHMPTTIAGWNTAWVSREERRPDSSLPSQLDVAFFPCNDVFLAEILRVYESTYRKQQERTPFRFNFHDMVWEPVFRNSTNMQGPIIKALQYSSTPLVGGQPKSAGVSHYGIPSYSSSPPVNNLVENLAVLQYLPFVDSFEDSNTSKTYQAGTTTFFFDNGWGTFGENWPPPNNVTTIMLSVHVDNRTEKTWGENIDYFRAREPIGCRDSRTLNFMRRLDVQAFFSGPRTLLMGRPKISNKERSDVLVTGLQRDVLGLLPRDVHKISISTEHFLNYSAYDRLAGYKAAHQLVEKIGSAKVVLTQDIGHALLCVALRTPVIFISSAKLDGKINDYNITELTPLFHNLQMTTKEQAKLWLKNYPWHAIPQNPNLGMAMRLKTTLWDVIRQNRFVRQAAQKFGTLPMSPLSPLPSQGLLFHLIFTTTAEQEHSGIPGGFNWRHMRTVESILYHHPASRVIVHSNTLPQDVFDVLTEVGYSVKVQKYNLTWLLKGSPAEHFTTKLVKAKSGGYWYSHQTDLIRLLLLYTYGGVYMDTDMILVRPLTSLPMNTLGFQVPDHSFANGALMMFHKSNSYIRACLEEFATHYDGGSWPDNGPGLLTRVWKADFNNSDVHVMPYQYFYMFSWEVVKDQGFHQTSGDDFDRNMEVLKSKAYSIHLNSKLTGSIGLGESKLKPGTIASYVLNSYCVLCNRMH